MELERLNEIEILIERLELLTCRQIILKEHINNEDLKKGKKFIWNYGTDKELVLTYIKPVKEVYHLFSYQDKKGNEKFVKINIVINKLLPYSLYSSEKTRIKKGQKLIKIYRLEHNSNSKGPYNNKRLPLNIKNKKILSNMTNSHYDDISHPNPGSDGILAIQWKRGVEVKYYMYGCTTLQSLYKWFKGYMDDLLKMGFQIVVYKVPEAYTIIGNSKSQIAFDKRYIKEREILN